MKNPWRQWFGWRDRALKAEARAEAAERERDKARERAEHDERLAKGYALESQHNRTKIARLRKWAEDQEHLIAAQVLDILDGKDE